MINTYYNSYYNDYNYMVNNNANQLGEIAKIFLNQLIKNKRCISPNALQVANSTIKSDIYSLSLLITISNYYRPGLGGRQSVPSGSQPGAQVTVLYPDYEIYLLEIKHSYNCIGFYYTVSYDHSERRYIISITSVENYDLPKKKTTDVFISKLRDIAIEFMVCK